MGYFVLFGNNIRYSVLSYGKGWEYMVSEEFWKRFDDAILKKGISSKFVADKCGIKYQTFKNQRSSRTVPRVDDIVQIAPLIGVSIDYLLTGKEAEPFCDEALLVDHDEKLRLIVRQLKADPTFLEAISIALASKERTDAANVVNSR